MNIKIKAETKKDAWTQVTKDKLVELGACSDVPIEWVVSKNTTDLLELYELAKAENHLSWANWFIVRIMNREQRIKYAIFAAESVLFMFEDKYPDDKRPRLAIVAAKAYLDDPNSADDAAAAAYYATAAYATAYAYDADAAAYAAYTAATAATATAYAAYAAYAVHATYASAYAAYSRDSRKDMQIKLIDYGLSLIVNSRNKSR